MATPNFIIGTMVNNGREKKSVIYSIFDDGDEDSLKIVRHKPIDLDSPKYAKQAIEELNAKTIRTEDEITSSLVIGLPIEGNKMTYFTANKALTGLNGLFPDIIHDKSKTLEESIGLIATRFKDMSSEQILEYFKLDPEKVVYDIKRKNKLSSVYWKDAFRELHKDAAIAANAAIEKAKIGSGFIMGLTGFFKEKIKNPFWFAKDAEKPLTGLKKFIHRSAKNAVTAQYAEGLLPHVPSEFTAKVAGMVTYAKRFANYKDFSESLIKDRAYPIFYELQKDGSAKPVSAVYVKNQMQMFANGLAEKPHFDIKMGYKDEMNHFHAIPFSDLQVEFNKRPDKDGKIFKMEDILQLVRTSSEPIMSVPNALRENPVTQTVQDLADTGENFRPLEM